MVVVCIVMCETVRIIGVSIVGKKIVQFINWVDLLTMCEKIVHLYARRSRLPYVGRNDNDVYLLKKI